MAPRENHHLKAAAEVRETSQFLYLVFWKKRKEDMRHYEGATQCVLAAAIPYFFCLAGTETKEDLVYTGR